MPGGPGPGEAGLLEAPGLLEPLGLHPVQGAS